MVSLDVFLPSVRRHIIGPLEIMMRQSLLESAIAFCRESLACRDRLMLDDVTKGAAIKLVDSPLVKCVKRLCVTNISDEVEGLSVLVAGIDFAVISANQISFTRDIGRVSIDFAIEPQRGVSEVPDILADDYCDVIAAGALDDLFMMPGKPWSDPQRAAYFNAQFIEGYRRAFRDALDDSPITTFHNPIRKHEFF